MVNLTIYYCTAMPNDLVSLLIRGYLMIREWKWNPYTHIYVEANGIVFDYTFMGVSTFTASKKDSMDEMMSRCGLIQEIIIEDLTEEEVFDNAYKLVEWKPMTYLNFFDNNLPLCTDVLFGLIDSNHPPVKLRPSELFINVLWSMLGELEEEVDG